MAVVVSLVVALGVAATEVLAWSKSTAAKRIALSNAEGDRPGAVLELPAEEVGAHGRLAVGRDVGAPEGEEAAARLLGCPASLD